MSRPPGLSRLFSACRQRHHRPKAPGIGAYGEQHVGARGCGLVEVQPGESSFFADGSMVATMVWSCMLPVLGACAAAPTMAFMSSALICRAESKDGACRAR